MVKIDRQGVILESKHPFASGKMNKILSGEMFPGRVPGSLILFGKEIVKCGNMRKNQPRISANLRESHFPYVRVLCSG